MKLIGLGPRGSPRISRMVEVHPIVPLVPLKSDILTIYDYDVVPTIACNTKHSKINSFFILLA
jgi:hypothetical protein